MIPDAVALWTGRVMLLLWAGLLVGGFAAVVRVWLLRLLAARRAPPTLFGFPVVESDAMPKGQIALVGDWSQRDYGDETDIAPELWYCLCCGRRSAIPADASCPDCGSGRWGNRADLPLPGEPRERR